MILAEIVDLIPYDQHIVVVLRAPETERILPIWVGAYESWIIASLLLGHEAFRPTTLDLAANLAAGAGWKVEQATIESMEGEVYYAAVILERGNKSISLDARPSDALAMALRTKAPVYVSEEVLAYHGTRLPDGAEPKWGRGLQMIAKSWDASFKEAASPPEPVDEGDLKKFNRQIVAFIMGKT